MATIEIKYNLGDEVYASSHEYTTKTMKCPDCLGTTQWIVKLPTGEEIDCECQTCAQGWNAKGMGVLTWQEPTPYTHLRTIGQVGFEGGMGRYMCEETGIGSGTVYTDKTLFTTRKEALCVAENRCEDIVKNLAKQNFKKKYDFANKLSSLGYERRAALEENAKMNRWKEIIKDA